MNNDLEKKLSSLPKPPLAEHSKQSIVETIQIMDTNTERKPTGRRTRITLGITGFLSFAIFLFIVLPYSHQDNTVGFVHEEQLREWKELEKFERPIQFPTYMPYEVESIHYEEMDVGPLQRSEDDTTIIVYYVLKDYPGDVISVEQQPATTVQLENYSHYKEEKLIEMENDVHALYLFNGAMQMLSWEDDGILFDLYYIGAREPGKREQVEEVPIEHLIQIAESFQPYHSQAKRR
ncbi:hypothetical protein [Alkalihalobacterium bogoriense]|uniref:hypothetical protein n=1 Tax=Alkalihalobacterium bogoriense TaxID=246272 RepID=UPI00047BFD91|nr:hypothetical protein [Alkalihalobacterium bogoriense]